MSTNWLHDLLFGSNESTIKALEKLQQIDAEQFQKVFSALKELQKSQIGDATQFKKVQEYLDGLQEKVETLIETVGEQEKIMATCIIVSAVAAIAVASFVAFCIYQGVKLEREKEKNLSKAPGTKLDDKVDTQAQQNSLHTPE